MRIKLLLFTGILVTCLSGCASDTRNDFPSKEIQTFLNKTSEFPIITNVSSYTYEFVNAGEKYVSDGHRITASTKLVNFNFEGNQVDNIVNYGFRTTGWNYELNQMFNIYSAYDNYLDYYVEFSFNDQTNNTSMQIYGYSDIYGSLLDGFDSVDKWINFDQTLLGLDSTNKIIPEYPNAQKMHYYEEVYETGTISFATFAFLGQHASEYERMLPTDWTYIVDRGFYSYMIDDSYGYEMDLSIEEAMDPLTKDYYTILMFEPYIAGADLYILDPTWSEIEEFWSTFNNMKNTTFTLPDLSTINSGRALAVEFVAKSYEYYDWFGIAYSGDEETNIKQGLENAGLYLADSYQDRYGVTYYVYVNEELITTLRYEESISQTTVIFYSYEETHDAFFWE